MPSSLRHYDISRFFLCHVIFFEGLFQTFLLVLFRPKKAEAIEKTYTLQNGTFRHYTWIALLICVFLFIPLSFTKNFMKVNNSKWMVSKKSIATASQFPPLLSVPHVNDVHVYLGREEGRKRQKSRRRRPSSLHSSLHSSFIGLALLWARLATTSRMSLGKEWKILPRHQPVWRRVGWF